MADLRDPDYIESTKKKWRSLPKEIIVVEFYGTGDPFFGGNADDRPLGINGRFLTAKEQSQARVPTAKFSTIEEAVAAGRAASNPRPNSLIGISCTWQ